MKIQKLIGVALVILFLGCTMYTTMWTEKAGKNLLESKFQGKTIGIIPMDIKFSSDRFVIDLRGVEMEVNGQKVQLAKKYLAEDDDMEFGHFGVLEVNPIKKMGTPEKPFMMSSAEMLKTALENKTTYKGTWAIGLGLGKGKSGLITNRKLKGNTGMMDELILDDSAEYPGYFSKVEIITKAQAADYDYVMTGDIDISNEVIEIITPPDSPSQGSILRREYISAGQYYLTMYADIDWTIRNAKTNEVVAKPDTDFGYKVYFPQTGDYKLPISNGDSAGFSKWFDEADMTDYVTAALEATIIRDEPIFTPFYVFDAEAVPVEK